MAWMAVPPIKAVCVPGETFGHDALEPFAGRAASSRHRFSLARPDRS